MKRLLVTSVTTLTPKKSEAPDRGDGESQESRVDRQVWVTHPQGWAPCRVVSLKLGKGSKMKKLSKAEKMVLRTFNFDASVYLNDPSLEGVTLWGKTNKATIRKHDTQVSEDTRLANLDKYIAQGYAFNPKAAVPQ